MVAKRNTVQDRMLHQLFYVMYRDISNKIFGKKTVRLELSLKDLLLFAFNKVGNEEPVTVLI